MQITTAVLRYEQQKPVTAFGDVPDGYQVLVIQLVYTALCELSAHDTVNIGYAEALMKISVNKNTERSKTQHKTLFYF